MEKAIIAENFLKAHWNYLIDEIKDNSKELIVIIGSYQYLMKRET